MGNSESSSQLPSRKADDGDKSSDRTNEKKPAEGGEGPSSAVKVGAALAGTALLALGAWGLSSSSGSGDPNGQRLTMESLDGGSRGGSGGGGYMPDEGSRLLRNPEPYPSQPRMIKIMTYNVWFREDVELHERMRVIGCLIQQHSPDVMFFQEVTPNIYRIFQSSSWWNSYESSVSPDKASRRYFCMLLSKLPVKDFISNPFENSTMGRELCVAKIDAGMGKKLIAATTHLESPTPLSMHSAERVAQAREAIGLLNYPPNVVFGGDMNWDDITDGPFPLLDGWVDAWAGLRPMEKGWTYDTETNRMLLGNRPLQKRLDRFVCKLSDFRLVGVEMIGMEAVPRISYFNKGKEYPVYPSDHYGLLLTIGAK